MAHERRHADEGPSAAAPADRLQSQPDQRGHRHRQQRELQGDSDDAVMSESLPTSSANTARESSSGSDTTPTQQVDSAHPPATTAQGGQRALGGGDLGALALVPFLSALPFHAAVLSASAIRQALALPQPQLSSSTGTGDSGPAEDGTTPKALPEQRSGESSLELHGAREAHWRWQQEEPQRVDLSSLSSRLPLEKYRPSTAPTQYPWRNSSRRLEGG